MEAIEPLLHTRAVVDDYRLIDHNIQIHGSKTVIITMKIVSKLLFSKLNPIKSDLCFSCNHFEDN